MANLSPIVTKNSLSRFKNDYLLKLFVVSIICFGSGCRFLKTGESTLKFDFDEDLPDIDLPPRAEPQSPKPKPFKQAIDNKFCEGLSPGSCFSLIIHIPQSNLVSDLGLSTLALASHSKAMNLRLVEACQAGWNEYKFKYSSASHFKHRHRFVNQVKKMRCLYIFEEEPTTEETLKLADNEIGFSIWLTQFEINGTQSSGKLGQLDFEFNRTNVLSGFRSVFVYSGSSVNPSAKGWDPVEGIGVKVTELKKNLDYDVRWKVDFKKVVDQIGAIVSDPAKASFVVRNFVDQARGLFQGNQSPSNGLNSGMVLVGIGFNALKNLCSENPLSCSVSHSRTENIPNINEEFSSALVPSSLTTELFRLAVARMVQGTLDEIMVSISPQQITKKFPSEDGILPKSN